MSELKLLVATWNVGSATPPSDLTPWLSPGRYDLIVVGAQEVPSQWRQESRRRRRNARNNPHPHPHHRRTRHSSGDTAAATANPTLPAAPPPAPNQHPPTASDDDAGSSGSGGKNDPPPPPTILSSFCDKDIPTLPLPIPAPAAACHPESSHHRRSPSPRWAKRALRRARGSPAGGIAAPRRTRSASPGRFSEFLTLKDTLSTPAPSSSSPTPTNPTTHSSSPTHSHSPDPAGTASAAPPTTTWGSHLANALGDAYTLVDKKSMLGIRLHIFAHRRVGAHRVAPLTRVAEGTGVANVLGNKGAVALKIQVDDTVIAFVSSHLAAHEGVRHLARRNDDVRDIMRSLEPVPAFNQTGTTARTVPVMHRAHHVFWMGDLNYRVDLGRTVPGAGEWGAAERLAFVEAVVGGGDMRALMANDELTRELSGRDGVFACFQEGEVAFPPTFKCLRDSKGFRYDEERLPSYCDRILWHSLPPQKTHIELDKYDAVPDIATSDHKPIFAAFTLFVPRKVIPPAPSAPALNLGLHILSLRTSVFIDPARRSETDPALANGTPLTSLAATAATTTNGFYQTFSSFDADISGSLADAAIDDDASAPRRPASRRLGTVHLLDWNFLHPSVDPKTLSAPVYPCVLPNTSGRLFVGGEARAEGPEAARDGAHLFGGPIALRPVKSVEDFRYVYPTLAFSRALAKPTPLRILRTASLPLSELLDVPVGDRKTVELDVLKFGSTVGTVQCEMRLVKLSSARS